METLNEDGLRHTDQERIPGMNRSVPIDSSTARYRSNGIEFFSFQRLPLWSEVEVVTIESETGQRASCRGVVVGCKGKPLFGYSVEVHLLNDPDRIKQHLQIITSLQWN